MCLNAQTTAPSAMPALTAAPKALSRNNPEPQLPSSKFDGGNPTRGLSDISERLPVVDAFFLSFDSVWFT